MCSLQKLGLVKVVRSGAFKERTGQGHLLLPYRWDYSLHEEGYREFITLTLFSSATESIVLQDAAMMCVLEAESRPCQTTEPGGSWSCIY